MDGGKLLDRDLWVGSRILDGGLQQVHEILWVCCQALPQVIKEKHLVTCAGLCVVIWQDDKAIPTRRSRVSEQLEVWDGETQ